MATETTARLYRQAIGIAEDNLHRAKMQRQADPNWESGHGEPIDLLIGQYQKEVNDLRLAAKLEGIPV